MQLGGTRGCCTGSHKGGWAVSHSVRYDELQVLTLSQNIMTAESALGEFHSNKADRGSYHRRVVELHLSIGIGKGGNNQNQVKGTALSCQKRERTEIKSA